MQDNKVLIELIMSGIMLMVIVGIFVRSLRRTNASLKPSGLGARVTQFTCVSLIIPAIIILGLEKILEGETIAQLLGV